MANLRKRWSAAAGVQQLDSWFGNGNSMTEPLTAPDTMMFLGAKFAWPTAEEFVDGAFTEAYKTTRIDAIANATAKTFARTQVERLVDATNLAKKFNVRLNFNPATHVFAVGVPKFKPGVPDEEVNIFKRAGPELKASLQECNKRLELTYQLDTTRKKSEWLQLLFDLLLEAAQNPKETGASGGVTKKHLDSVLAELEALTYQCLSNVSAAAEGGGAAAGAAGGAAAGAAGGADASRSPSPTSLVPNRDASVGPGANRFRTVSESEGPGGGGAAGAAGGFDTEPSTPAPEDSASAVGGGDGGDGDGGAGGGNGPAAAAAAAVADQNASDAPPPAPGAASDSRDASVAPTVGVPPAAGGGGGGDGADGDTEDDAEDDGSSGPISGPPTSQPNPATAATSRSSSAPKPPPAAAAPPATAALIETLREQIGDLEEANRDIVKENGRLEEENQTLQAAKSEADTKLQTTVANRKKALGLFEAEVNTQKATIAKLENDVREATKKIQDIGQQNLTDLDQMRNAVKDEKDALKTEMENRAAEQLAEQQATFAADVKRLTQEIANQKAELDKAAEQETQAAAQHAIDLKAVKQTLEDYQKQNLQLDDDLKAAQDEVTQEKAAAAQERTTQAQVIADLRAEVVAKEQAVTNAVAAAATDAGTQQKLQDLGNQVADLQKELTQVNEAGEEMKKSVADAAKDVAKRDRDINTLKAEKEDLARLLKTEQTEATANNLRLLAQIAAEKQAKRDAETEQARLQQELATLQSAPPPAAAQTASTAAVQQLQNDLQAAQQRIAQQTMEIANLQTAQQSAPAQTANPVLQQMQTALQLARQEIANLKAAQAQQGPANAAMIQQLQGDLQAAQTDLAARVQELTNTNADYQASQNEVKKLQRQINTLQTAAAVAPINAAALTTNQQTIAQMIYRLLSGEQLFGVISAEFGYAVTPDFIWHWVGVLVAEERELVKKLINTDAKEIQEKRKQILRYIWHNRFQITQDHAIWSTTIQDTGLGGGYMYANPGERNNDPVVPYTVTFKDYNLTSDLVTTVPLDIAAFQQRILMYRNIAKSGAPAGGAASGGAQAAAAGGGPAGGAAP